MVTQKRCNKCTQTLSIEQFHKNKTTNDGYQKRCIPCRRAHDKALAGSRNLYKLRWATENKERIKEMRKRHFEEHPEALIRHRQKAQEARRRRIIENPAKHLEHYLKSVFGINLEVYNCMLELQDYSCAICFSPSEENTHGRLYVDHCHDSGQVRGLLCQKCNSILGYAKDQEEVLLNAIEYLKRSKNGYKDAI